MALAAYVTLPPGALSAPRPFTLNSAVAMPITATLISDDESFRQQLAGHLNHSRAFHCVGSYASAADLCSRFTAAPSDIVVLEVDYGRTDWLEDIGRIKVLAPSPQVLLVVATEVADLLVPALARGACGYMLRAEAQARLLQCLEEVQNGVSPISGQVARRLVSHLQHQAAPWQNVGGLSLREKEILEYLARGYPYKQIAGHLDISINTVRTYVRRLYSKLQVPCRAHAVLKCQPGSVWDWHPGAKSAGNHNPLAA